MKERKGYLKGRKKYLKKMKKKKGYLENKYLENKKGYLENNSDIEDTVADIVLTRHKRDLLDRQQVEEVYREK